eukprot:2861318-Pleurochrysis_carterae.AAC.1
MAVVNVLSALRCSGLFATSMADLLSMERVAGSACGRPSSEKSADKYTASLVALEAATAVSASQEKRATAACFFED